MSIIITGSSFRDYGSKFALRNICTGTGGYGRVDSSEITLIDSNGCPTDHFIMGPLFKSSSSGKVRINISILYTHLMRPVWTVT